MILGIGTDIVQIPRIQAIFDRFGNGFAEKILSLAEYENYLEIIQENHKVRFLAKRFAAKEAVSKAIGTGIQKIINLKSIEIINNNEGKPIVKVFNLTSYKIFVSISDDYPVAIAFAVISF